MFDKFPYTNFHELNLDYFINKFNEIFTEWEQLNSTMLEWKAATDASNALWKTSVENGLAAWKTATEADLNARETALRAELSAWKATAEADIGTWETDTLAALNAWKATAEATFEAIRVQAAASATAAQTAQTAAETAQTAAETAQTAAETAAASISASAAQIATNTGDISDLKTQLNDVEGFTENLMIFDETVNVASDYYAHVNEFSPARKYCLKITVGADGLYTFQTGTLYAVSYMVDTLAENINLKANEEFYIYDYVPSQTGLTYVRNSVGGNWSVSVFEIVNTEKTLENLSDTKIELETLENSLGKSPNLFDKTAVTDDYYYSLTLNSTPELKPNANFCAIMIDVKPNTKYTANYNDFSYGMITENNIVAGSASTATFTTRANTSKLTISVNKSHKDTFMIVEGETLPIEYIPFGEYTKYAIREKTYEVGAGKTFTSFTACLEALQGNEEQKTILVYAGTYDIFDEIGGSNYCDTIQASDNWRDVSVVVPPNTKIVGVGDVILEFLPENSEITSIARGVLSALNVSGNVEIENIKIHAKNCRYCIHDETSSLAQFNNVTHKYKNIECVKYSGGGDAQAYAAGFQLGGKYDFENCVFKSEQGKAFSMHNSSTGGVTINLTNCIFVTTTAAVSVDLINVSGQQVRNITNLFGCYLENSGGSKKLSVTGGPVNTFDVTLIASSDIGDTTIDISGNPYPIKQYNKFVT